MAQKIYCYHCQLPVPKDAGCALDIDGVPRVFCCDGCRTVAETIVAGGLQAYYRKREQAASGGSREDANTAALYDSAAFACRYIRDIASSDAAIPDLHEIELLIEGMECAACVWLIESYLQQIPAVSAATINYDQRRLRLRWHGPLDGSGKLSPLINAVERLGYRVSIFHPDQQASQILAEQRAQLRRLGVAFIGMMQVGMFAIGFYSNDLEGGLQPQWDALLRWISFLVTTPVLLYSCQPFFIGAWRSLKTRRLNMDVPVALSLLLAYSASAIATIRHNGDVYFDAVTMFAFFLLGGRYLETRIRASFMALGDSRRNLLPEIVWRRLDDGTLQATAIEEAGDGMALVVKPHDIIPVDGTVIDHAVHVDEAAFTGEAEAVQKAVGSTVYGGTVNGAIPLHFIASNTTRNGRLQQVVNLITYAHRDKPPPFRLADRLARHFIMLILLTAVAAYCSWLFIDASRAFHVMLAVLAASCPCALSLATPAVLTAAATALRRQGILIMSGHALEVLPRVKRFVFDKTGTLTDGSIKLGEMRISDESSLYIAAALEKVIAHPIADAFADIEAPPASQVEIKPGQGVQGFVGGTFYRLGDANFTNAGATLSTQNDKGRWIYLADTQQVLAAFQLLDHTRASAKPTIDDLRDTHFISLLSGDGSANTAALAHELGIDDVICGASPQQKLECVHAWQRQGECVAMVGDGINDAPVISAADVSIAVANASNITRAQADCILLSPTLTKLLELNAMAHRTQRLIRQNLTWALAYNALVIPLAFGGVIKPWLAAAGMSLSSLLVMLNSQRLLR